MRPGFALLAALSFGCCAPTDGTGDHGGVPIDGGSEPVPDVRRFCGPDAAGELRDGELVIVGPCLLAGARAAGEFDQRGVVEVTGRLRLQNGPDLSVAEFDSVRHVGGSLAIIGNDLLTTARFPALESVGSNVEVDANDVLAQFSIPSLARVGGSMILRNNPLLGVCQADEAALRAQIDIARDFVNADNCAECCVGEPVTGAP